MTNHAEALAKALESFASIKVSFEASTEIVPNGYSNPEDWRNAVYHARAALEAYRQAPDGWQDIGTAPETETTSFLILLPEQRTKKGEFLAERCVVQVSRFEGQLYPDVLGSCIGWDDRVAHATHWRACPEPPIGGAQ